MDISQIITLVFLVAGIALVLLEMALPGLVVVFLGGAAILVAGLRWLGVLESLEASLVVWMALSVVLMVLLRQMLQKWVPSESRFDGSDEQSMSLGQVVEVVRTCSEGEDGRIRWEGTLWRAQTLGGRIEAGQQARLMYRDNLVWIVEPYDETAQALRQLEHELASTPEPAESEAARQPVDARRSR